MSLVFLGLFDVIHFGIFRLIDVQGEVTSVFGRLDEHSSYESSAQHSANDVNNVEHTAYGILVGPVLTIVNTGNVLFSQDDSSNDLNSV